MKHHNIRHGKAVPLEVLRAMEIKGFVDVLQLHHDTAILRHIGGIDLFIIVRVYKKPEAL